MSDSDCKEMRAALSLAEGVLSLLFYRATVDWGHLGVPTRESVDAVISQCRAALKREGES